LFSLFVSASRGARVGVHCGTPHTHIHGRVGVSVRRCLWVSSSMLSKPSRWVPLYHRATASMCQNERTQCRLPCRKRETHLLFRWACGSTLLQSRFWLPRQWELCRARSFSSTHYQQSQPRSRPGCHRSCPGARQSSNRCSGVAQCTRPCTLSSCTSVSFVE